MEKSRGQNVKFAVCGLLAGAANGLFGTGGGMVLVPLYTTWAKLGEKEALATSVATILPISLVSAAIYFSKSAFNLTDALPYLIGGLAGGTVAGIVFKKIAPAFLRRAFALLLIYGGIRSFI